MSGSVRVRFAPSPTGYLHIGGVRHRRSSTLALGAKDRRRLRSSPSKTQIRKRSTPESVEVILDSRCPVALGTAWDEGPQVGGAHGPYTQMERLGIYRAKSEELIASGKAYRCYCTKDELDTQRAALKAKDPKATFKYPGTCRSRTDAPDLPFVVRLRVPETGAVTYVDKVFGEVTTPNSAQQDFVLIRSDGVPLYNFGCVVDDMTMEMTLVARGRDHMVNTPPQLMLYEAFGAAPPAFAHLPMMLAPNGEKLSKRHGAVSVGEYRAQGYTPAAVLNYLARFGWSHGDQEVFSREELIAAFDWEHCGRGDGKFDAKKFLAIQQEHLKSPRLTSDDAFADGALPFLAQRGLVGLDRARVLPAIPTIRERATTRSSTRPIGWFYFRDPPVMDAKAVEKFLGPASAPRLEAFANALAHVEPWSEAPLEAAAVAWLTEQKLEIKDVAQPARVALTGRSATPGLYQVMAVLGRERTLARLRASSVIA